MSLFKQCCGSVAFWYGSGSATLTYGSGFGSCFFSSEVNNIPTKNKFFKSFFAYYFLKVSVFKYKKSKRSQKIVYSFRNQGFSYPKTYGSPLLSLSMRLCHFQTVKFCRNQEVEKSTSRRKFCAKGSSKISRRLILGERNRRNEKVESQADF